jgi:hypothetical protein
VVEQIRRIRREQSRNLEAKKTVTEVGITRWNTAVHVTFIVIMQFIVSRPPLISDQWFSIAAVAAN